MTTRRLKTYSAESGYVYQYFFLESRERRGFWGRTGTAFLFSVSGDGRTSVELEIAVEDAALHAWGKAHGRALTGTETYAAAKMRLFRVFDETPSPAELQHARVDSSNIEALLQPLKLD